MKANRQRKSLKRSNKKIGWKEKESTALLLPTGATTLNLALSDSAKGAIPTGSMCNIVGDSDTGKSIIAWTLLAEATHCEEFDDFELYYDDVESKARFPIVKLFGSKVKDRVIFYGLPEEDKKTEVELEDSASDTIEGLYSRLQKLLDAGKPFVYVVDSFDALSDKEERLKKELKRDYPAKPRLASEMFRKICNQLERTQSILIIVSQVRQAIGVTFGKKLSRSGGKALRFYCLQEIWLAIKQQITREVKKQKRKIGATIICHCEKNHFTGKRRDCEFEIYYDYGVDSIGSTIKFLCDTGRWKIARGVVDSPWGKMAKDKLVAFIEEKELSDELNAAAQEEWRAIEKAVELNRKRKYEE